MLTRRIIPVILLNDGMVVQTRNFRITNIIHTIPAFAIKFFGSWNADEIIISDISKKKNKRVFHDSIKKITEECFVPITVGGSIYDSKDIETLLKVGADKVIINGGAHTNKEFVKQAVHTFGSQCIVASIDYKTYSKNKKVFIHNGEYNTNLDPQDWYMKLKDDGAGEFFFNSIDNDGTDLGFDYEFVDNIQKEGDPPIIVFGGGHCAKNFIDVLVNTNINSIAAANIFHYSEGSIIKLKNQIKKEYPNIRL